MLGDVVTLPRATSSCPKRFYVSTENLAQGFQGLIPYLDNVAIKGVSFQEGDTLLANIRPYLKKALLASFDGCCSADVICFRPKEVLSEYLYYIIANDRFIAHVMEACKGSKMPRGDKNWMLQKQIFVPTTSEQRKAANLLNLLDQRITTQNKIIEDLKRLRKRIADSLVRIIPNAFLRVQMRDILNERSERNQSNYPVFSVAVEAGVVDQIQHLGRSFAAKETSHYRVAYYGDVVYTKSPTGAYPFGIIKQSQNNTPVALSPLYGVYSPSSFETGYFLHCFFLNETNANNYLHPLVDKGAKNTMNITNQRFLDGCVPIPKASALQAIYGLLASIENKLALNLKIRNAYQSQKTFLLKNLFI